MNRRLAPKDHQTAHRTGFPSPTDTAQQSLPLLPFRNGTRGRVPTLATRVAEIAAQIAPTEGHGEDRTQIGFIAHFDPGTEDTPLGTRVAGPSLAGQSIHPAAMRAPMTLGQLLACDRGPLGCQRAARSFPGISSSEQTDRIQANPRGRGEVPRRCTHALERNEAQKSRLHQGFKSSPVGDAAPAVWTRLAVTRARNPSGTGVCDRSQAIKASGVSKSTVVRPSVC